MATYQIDINEKMIEGKQTAEFLRLVPVPEAVSVRTATKQSTMPGESELYKHLKSAFRDVRLMMEGKKRKKTLDEFLDELRNSNY
jgi:hypothetical protein